MQCVCANILHILVNLATKWHVWKLIVTTKDHASPYTTIAFKIYTPNFANNNIFVKENVTNL